MLVCFDEYQVFIKIEKAAVYPCLAVPFGFEVIK